MWNAPFPANRIFFDCHFYITRKIPPWIPCNLWRILDFHKSSLQVLQSLSLPDAYCLRRSLLCLSVTMVVCSVFQSLLNFSPSSVEILRVYLTILLCGLLQAQNFLTPFFHNIQCYTSFLYPFSMNIFILFETSKWWEAQLPETYLGQQFYCMKFYLICWSLLKVLRRTNTVVNGVQMVHHSCLGSILVVLRS